jgi:hypothetical protein
MLLLVILFVLFMHYYYCYFYYFFSSTSCYFFSFLQLFKSYLTRLLFISSRLIFPLSLSPFYFSFFPYCYIPRVCLVARNRGREDIRSIFSPRFPFPSFPLPFSLFFSALFPLLLFPFPFSPFCLLYMTGVCPGLQARPIVVRRTCDPFSGETAPTAISFVLVAGMSSLTEGLFIIAFFIFKSDIFYFVFYFILFYFILYFILFCILFYFILFYFILFYFILFYFILFYFILFYFILYFI